MTVKSLSGTAAAILLAAALPAAAQDSDAPVDVTAAPPPSAETIGPSQLRDFNLQGTVTRPSERSAEPDARPATAAPAAPRPAETNRSEAAAVQPPDRAVPAAGSQTVLPAPAEIGAGESPRQADSGSRLVTPSLPLEVTTNPAARPGSADASSSVDASLAPANAFDAWPWLAALIALIGGAAFIAWSRRGLRNRYADPGRMAFAGPAPEVAPEVGRDLPGRPRPDPVPPVARPTPLPAPRRDPVPKPADDGLIVSTSLRPQLSVQFAPDRLVVNGSDVALQFDVVITNSGSAPARDVLVEARMFTAHPTQDRDIATFFQKPVGTGDRIPAIVPLGRLSLKSAVRLPIDQLHSFEAGGRKLFVPLVGFNILFRSNGDDGQASASFLVGRGDEQDEKLAPFRLDLGPRIFRGLSARAHSLGLQPA